MPALVIDGITVVKRINGRYLVAPGTEYELEKRNITSAIRYAKEVAKKCTKLSQAD